MKPCTRPLKSFNSQIAAGISARPGQPTLRRAGAHDCALAHRSRGSTIIELLVSIGIVTVLAAVVLPAIENAREAARKTQCRNNLKQMGLAVHAHEATFGSLPSNGWGFAWQGDPNRSTGPSQPGGWIYNLLDYIDQTTLKQTGAGLSGDALRQSITKRQSAGIPTFVCPSRPNGGVGKGLSIPFRNADSIEEVAKTDYACNEGDVISNTLFGPDSLEEGDSPFYVWIDTRRLTGVCFQRSAIRVAEIDDGLSNTLFAAEKYVNAQSYYDVKDSGYDQSLYSGVDLDLNRWTLTPPSQDNQTDLRVRSFGSAHPQAMHALSCDGSVRSVSYSVDERLFRNFGVRNDGEATLP